MTIEERIEAAQKLIEEAKAELAAKAAPRRNWPEKVEAGDCFERNGSRYVMLADQLIDLDRDTTWAGANGFDGDEKDFAYIGKLDLTIRTDAHEPTGEELVGKMCEFSDAGFETFTSSRKPCHEYKEGRGYKDHNGAWWNIARLAR